MAELVLRPQSEFLSELQARLIVRGPTDPVSVDFVISENPLRTNRTVVSGTVKWDGCIDLETNSFRLCDIKQVLAFNEFITKIYIEAGGLLGERADNDAFASETKQNDA